MSSYKFCSCLTEKTQKDCIKSIDLIDTELIEHRIDFLENIKETNLKEIYEKAHNTSKKIIATCRNKICKSSFNGNEKERIKILKNAIISGADFVDIEIETEEKLRSELINFAKENNCKVIISTHNFDQTPSKEVLVKYMNKEKELGADIGKIVTFANSKEDANVVLDLLIQAKKINFDLVAFAMGPNGSFSRAKALILGAPFTFVSFNKASAPGQLTKEEIEKEILKEN